MMPRLRLSLSLLVFTSACGGMAKPTHSPSRAAASTDMDDVAGESAPSHYGDSEGALSPEEKISMLHNQIGDLRTNAGLPREPMSEAVMRAHSDPAPVAPTSVEAGSEAHLSNSCTDTCNLKKSICSNSAKICNLASELDSDWADEKCDSSKVSCSEATTSCDECN